MPRRNCPRCRALVAAAPLHLLLDRGAIRRHRVAIEVDADREGTDERRLVLVDDLGFLVVDPRLEVAVDRLEEVLDVVADLEAQEVVAEEAVEELVLPGQGAEGLRVRPGDVPELGHDQVGVAAP